MDKSSSDSNINLLCRPATPADLTTPTNYLQQRIIKRKRDCDCGEELETLREEIKAMFQSLMTSQENETKKIKPTLIEIQQTNKNIETSLAFLASQNEDLKKKVELLQLQAKKDRENITVLEDKIEELQRERRNKHFEMKNVPKTNEENKSSLINMVLTLSKNIGYSLARSDIKDIYRVKSAKVANKNTPIIVEMSSTLIKHDFLRTCKTFNAKKKEKLRAKHLGFTNNEDQPIFTSEQLTAKGSRLFFLARDLAKSRGYKFCWTNFGKVYVRKEENSTIIWIKNEAQIHNLLQEA